MSDASLMMQEAARELHNPSRLQDIMSKVSCLLRTHRLKGELSQKELAVLVPRTGINRVWHVERNLRPPNAREILAYWMIFGLLPDEIFPGAVSEVEEAVLRNAYSLYQKYEGDTSAKAVRKRAFLEAIAARAADRARKKAK
jgi:hypothetical protein